MTANSQLIYIHDPMCSWCWAFAKVYRKLIETLPDSIQVRRLLGGLAPDSGDPMPPAMRQYLQQTWKRIESTVPGTRFNYDFWRQCRPRRSTYPACRAVIAARAQGLQYDVAMTNAIQEGYYLHAKNPSDDHTLVEFAGALGLDTDVFSTQLNAESTRRQLDREIVMARQLGVQGFPALIVYDGNAARPVRVDYNDAELMLDSVILAAINRVV